MKNVKYESLTDLPPIGSMWVANPGVGFSGIAMNESCRLHQYDESEVIFKNGTYCAVLESWHANRNKNMITVILPVDLRKYTLEYDGQWESHGWEKV